jgi:ketosteroid isomerase-like protein
MSAAFLQSRALIGSRLAAMPSTTSSQAEIRAFLDSRSEAIWTKDLDRLLSFYSPDIVYFDIVPPLQYLGSAALRERFAHWFDGFEGSIGQRIHDLTIKTSGDLAVASMLIRAGGTRTNGHEVEFWVRATSTFQRSANGWLITHEHVSLPADLQSGTAVTNLAP